MSNCNDYRTLEEYIDSITRKLDSKEYQEAIAALGRKYSPVELHSLSQTGQRVKTNNRQDK